MLILHSTFGFSNEYRALCSNGNQDTCKVQGSCCIYHTLYIGYGQLHHTVLILYGLLQHIVFILYGSLHHTVFILYGLLHHIVFISYGPLHHTVFILYGPLHHTMFILHGLLHHFIYIIWFSSTLNLDVRLLHIHKTNRLMFMMMMSTKVLVMIISDDFTFRGQCWEVSLACC